MRKIKVLVVDDAILVRKVLGDALNDEPQIEVVDFAPNGNVALQKIPLCEPDIVTLDVEMPEMNGLETMRHIRERFPKLPVIMFSSLTTSGASATIEALSLGASDYVTKPVFQGGVGDVRERIKRDLVRKILLLCGRGTAEDLALGETAVPVVRRTPNRVVGIAPIEAVVIGVSTGGPRALEGVLSGFGSGLPVPVFIVQHMPPLFTKMLADRLADRLKLRVFEAAEGVLSRAGEIYVAPGDFHISLEDRPDGVTLRCHQGPPENSCRPAADVLFRSAAAIYKTGLLGVVLTGMGRDGLNGSEAICKAGGAVIVQDEPTSVVWGMPGCVARAGLAEAVLPLERVGAEIVFSVMSGRVLPQDFRIVEGPR